MPSSLHPRARVFPRGRMRVLVVLSAFTLLLAGCEKPVSGQAHGLPSMVLFKTDLSGGYEASDQDSQDGNSNALFDDKDAKECITAGQSAEQVIGRVNSQSFDNSSDDSSDFTDISSAVRSYPAAELVAADVAKWRDTKTGDCLEQWIKDGMDQDDNGTVDDLKVAWDAPPASYPRSVVRILRISGTATDTSSDSQLGDPSDPTDPSDPSSTGDPTPTPDPSDPSLPDSVTIHADVALLAWGTIEAEVMWSTTGDDDLPTDFQKRLVDTVADRIDPR